MLCSHCSNRSVCFHFTIPSKHRRLRTFECLTAEWLLGSGSPALSIVPAAPHCSHRQPYCFMHVAIWLFPRKSPIISEILFILWAAQFFCLILGILSASQDWPLSCLTCANVWKSMGKPCSCMQKRLFFSSFTISRVRICIRYCKSCSEIEGSYDKIIIAIVPNYTGKKYHKFAAIDITTHHSTKLYQKYEFVAIYIVCVQHDNCILLSL